ncbi:GNAT family N-acetyltransferase [Sphingomonas naphthae]|uniref:GNAT family N-acetyltransferase n=1 Tax=Sphingomonas naphthae TaxID=1813468 RepID=A0ABY7TH02_9SPHN|nr:GNAT family N-acetyltransferase [Sphingomonas naphthae]WCT72512.1 GNAT family N-acetyltransferase [Sphingomonas naphthae]
MTGGAIGQPGLDDIPGDLLAAVVTFLERTEKPRPAPMPASPLRLKRWNPSAEAYRTLFRRVGAPWLWFSRLAMKDETLEAILTAPTTEIYAACDRQGIELGLLELDFRPGGETNLAFFGLVPELAGKGLGRWLMANAFALGWRADTVKMSVHTCSLDHPKALGFYRAQGFVAYKRAIERFPDPRVLGLLPRDMAPQIPLLAPES